MNGVSQAGASRTELYRLHMIRVQEAQAISLSVRQTNPAFPKSLPLSERPYVDTYIPSKRPTMHRARMKKKLGKKVPLAPRWIRTGDLPFADPAHNR